MRLLSRPAPGPGVYRLPVPEMRLVHDGSVALVLSVCVDWMLEDTLAVVGHLVRRDDGRLERVWFR